MTPFMALYGYQPPSITSYLRENSKVQAVEHHIEHQQQVLQLLKDNLVLAQNRMKQQADQHRSERSFDVGDWVFLRLQPYKQMSLKQAKKDNKLSPKCYEIDQFQSILSSGRTYPLKIPHGRMRILCRSIQNYSSVEDNTFLKERGMLGPYNTSDYPITIVVIPLINIVVPLLPPYCYYCAP
jgi:hypothetical protein